MEAEDDAPKECKGCYAPADALDLEEELYLYLTGYCTECVPPDVDEQFQEWVTQATATKQ